MLHYFIVITENTLCYTGYISLQQTRRRQLQLLISAIATDYTRLYHITLHYTRLQLQLQLQLQLPSHYRTLQLQLHYTALSTQHYTTLRYSTLH